MENFVVSAIKYRPQSFDDVVGQKVITDTLDKAIKNNHLAQALLFCGPRGVGKTTCARIVARRINGDIKFKDKSRDFSFNIFELDAASNNSVEDIRTLIEQVRIPPQLGNFKVYIIDEAHMLSQSAFNAFLKTLEEPPKHAIFILATTEKQKIIPTILSRCQIFDFKRIDVSDMKTYLKHIAKTQDIEIEDEAAQMIAEQSDGALRDSLSTFDRMVSFSGKTLTTKNVAKNLNVLDRDTFIKVTELAIDKNIPDLMLCFDDILKRGYEGKHFLSGLMSHLRDLMLCKINVSEAMIHFDAIIKDKYLELSKKTEQDFLIWALDLINETDFQYKQSHNQRVLVELCLMQLASYEGIGLKKKGD